MGKRSATNTKAPESGKRTLNSCLKQATSTPALSDKLKAIRSAKEDGLLVLGGFLLGRFMADKSIPQGAATTVYAAVAPAVPRGEYLSDCAVASQRSDQAKDDALADALWELTEARLDAAVAKRGL